MTTTQTVVRVPEPWRVPLAESPTCLTTRMAAADWCRDHGLETEAEGLTWSAAKGLVPYLAGPDLWYPDTVLPDDMHDNMPVWDDFYGSKTVALFFDKMLTAWAAGTDSQRRSWWAWTPERD